MGVVLTNCFCDCSPWFVRGARVNARPLEVVVLMDFLEDANMQPSTGITDGIKAAALAVARSLTTRDKVGMCGS